MSSVCPCPTTSSMIAGQPNGYFSADWDSFQNHAVIRHLARNMVIASSAWAPHGWVLCAAACPMRRWSIG